MNLIREFNRAEVDYFDKELRGIQVWPLIRENIYLELYRTCDKADKANRSDLDQSVFMKLKSFFLVLINSISFLLKAKRKVEYIFISHPRKKRENGLYKDIYTDPIIDDLSSDYVVLEGLFQLGHFKPSYRRNVIYLDIFDYWPRLVSLLWTPKLLDHELKPWRKLETEISEHFGIRIDIIDKIKKEYVRARISIWGLKRLIRRLQPKLIVEVVGYSRLCKHINIAAKDLKIGTLELQHSHINKSHRAYNFPPKIGSVASFPDYFGVWSSYYRNRVALPIENERIVVCGFKYFEDQAKRSKNIDSNSILFVSQGTIGNKLSLLALDLAKVAPRKIIYKLHPGEIQDARVRYPHLYQANNVIVDDKMSSDLYKRILEAECVIGVYSTALVEAVNLGKIAIVVGLPGWEYFEELIDDSSFPMVYSDADPKQLLNQIAKSREERHYAGTELIEPYDASFLKVDEVS